MAAKLQQYILSEKNILVHEVRYAKFAKKIDLLFEIGYLKNLFFYSKIRQFAVFFL